MLSKQLFLLLGHVLFIQMIFAQEGQNIKFGKITASDFNNPALQFDSGANAVIIADIGNTRFEGNSHGSFTLIFTHFLRVKIMNKNGFDIGNREISLYHNQEGDFEKLYSLKASTFNLENALITETKLDEKAVFDVKFNNNINDKKFSMPALKEGAIFDIEYTVKSPFTFRLMPWSFQGEYPRLWSEYTVVIPPPLHYVMRIQGDEHFFIDTTKEVFQSYSVHFNNGASSDDNYSVNGNSTYKKWVKKNVLALQEEAFITTLDNYYSRVTFQLSYVQWDNKSEKHEVMSTWNARSKDLLEDADFGLALNRENGWMSDELKGIVQGSNSNTEKAKRIFYYIRDNFKVVSRDGYGKRGLYTHQSLKDLFKKREGNVAEINLLLTAILRKSGIEADPVILSTRDNGVANPSYPLLAEYNYVICVAFIEDKMVNLDASQPYSRYGQLPNQCYNGWAHIVNEERPMPIYFSADSMLESSLTNVIIVNDEKGKPIGGFSKNYGNNESNDVREEIASSSLIAYEKKIQTANESNFKIDNFRIDSLKMADYPMVLHYDFEPKNLIAADILYFNPMMGEGYKSNPFKSMERHYPVEFPYLIDETYMLNLYIPAGYTVDELPKSARIAFNENEGFFEYLIQKGESNIQMRMRLKLNKSLFLVDDYGALRDFFAYIVKKEGEQIVFKKIK